MPGGCRRISDVATTQKIRESQRIPLRRKSAQRWSDPAPRYPAEQHEQDRQREPGESVVVGFPRVTNISVGRREGCKEGDTHHGATHFAVADVIARHAAARLTAEVGVVQQRAGVAGQQDKR